MKSLEQQPKINSQERAYNDVTTWAAEVLDGSMRTSFEYEFDGRELYASDGGNLRDVFDKAVTGARQAAAADPRLKFEVDRRVEERNELDEMIKMASGHGANTMVVVSDRPNALEHVHEDIGGYNGQRRQAMLRVISRTEGGKIRITSQSLDKSDRTGLEAIYSYFGLRPEPGELLGQRINVEMDDYSQAFLSDTLTRQYDKTLEQKYGQPFQAGRTPAETENTYDFVLAQQDLLEAFIAKPVAADEDLYGLAAALEERWNSRHRMPYLSQSGTLDKDLPSISAAQTEMALAAARAVSAGKTFSGCGMSVGKSTAYSQLEVQGYGSYVDNEELTDKYGSLTFRCQKGHLNRRPHGKLIDCCQTCGIDVKC